jgi:acetylornithine/N-succinyldiaminopimelate aminotransferase
MSHQPEKNSSERLAARFELVMMPNYATPALAIDHGRGSMLYDLDDNGYLDLLGGIAVSALGHGHPAVVEAVGTQVAKLAHCSNLYLHEPGVRLAERLLAMLRTDGGVFFANSSAEAVEAALKLVRRYAGAKRPYVVAAENSFHGRTAGALSLTGRADIREPFAPFGTPVRFVPYGSAGALAAAVTDECAAIFLEPFQGEAGVIEPPPGYLQAARDICDDTGAVLVLDEVQSGIGRTGEWFYHQHAGVRPDVVTLAKGLGGGLPIGACIGFGPYGSVLTPGDHGSTFGGNPVSCAAALGVLDAIERDGLLESATRVGALLSDGIARLEHPLLAGVRGRGLWLAVLLGAPLAARAEAAAREAGFLIQAIKSDVLRLAPPLILTVDEAQTFLDALPTILSVAAGREPVGGRR